MKEVESGLPEIEELVVSQRLRHDLEHDLHSEKQDQELSLEIDLLAVLLEMRQQLILQALVLIRYGVSLRLWQWSALDQRSLGFLNVLSVHTRSHHVLAYKHSVEELKCFQQLIL